MTDKTPFMHTTYRNIEERMTNMLIYKYWDYIIDQLQNTNSITQNLLDKNDIKKIIKDGPITCLATFMYSNSDDIQYNSTFKNK